MTPEGRIEINDIVEVRRIRFNAPDEWIGAIVTHVDDRKLEVKALKDTFDGEHDQVALPMFGKERFWR